MNANFIFVKSFKPSGSIAGAFYSFITSATSISPLESVTTDSPDGKQAWMC